MRGGSRMLFAARKGQPMSRKIALDQVFLRPSPRFAHTDYSLGYHTEYIRKKTGLDPATAEAQQKFNDEVWAMDFNWGVDDGLHGDWGRRGRATDMGHAEYAAGGSDMRKPAACPFKTAAEVWGFDAIREYGLPDRKEQVDAYEKYARDTLSGCPGQLTTGGYYKTIVSGAIEAFGWEMFLLALSEPSKMEPVLDGIYRFTQFHMDCWAATSIEVIMQHDDFVWTEGAFMNPEIYRKVIIPRYAELWKPLRKAGKKIIFCSDGNFMEFAGDILDAGADGLCFEPCNDFQFMAERYGDSAVLIGSFTDCRDMAFSTWDVVRSSIDRTLDIARKRCRGLIYAVGNHIPVNVPDGMKDLYIGHLKANWKR